MPEHQARALGSSTRQPQQASLHNIVFVTRCAGYGDVIGIAYETLRLGLWRKLCPAHARVVPQCGYTLGVMDITKALTRLNGSGNDPVFLLLHGWGSNELDLPDLLRYCGAGSADFVSLRAPIAYGMGFTWFGEWAHEGVPEGRSLTRQAYDAADAVNRWVEANVNGSRPIVTMGFSQGGLLATHMLRFDPKRYAAAISFSGWLAPGSLPGDKALESAQPPVFYGHGSADVIFPTQDVLAMSSFWRRHGTLSEHIYSGMGHSINMDELRDVQRFLESNNLIRPQM